MKKFICIPMVFLMVLGCGPGFQVAQTPPIPPTELELLQAQIDALKSASLIKEMNFDTADGLVNGASVSTHELTLANPTNNNQYVDTGATVKDVYQSTMSVWFKTDDPNKIQHIFWQGVHDQNGWGSGQMNNAHAELNITLNHYNDLTATVVSAFLGFNEGAISPDPMPVAFPVTRNPGTGLFEVTGARTSFDTNWHLLTVTVDQKISEVTVTTYMDGVLIEQGTGTQIDTSLWDSNIFLGKAGADGIRNFSGKMKKFLLFNKILTAEEVLALYKVQKETP